MIQVTWDPLWEESFPSLYALILSKDAWVVDLWDEIGTRGHWFYVFLNT